MIRNAKRQLIAEKCIKRMVLRYLVDELIEELEQYRGRSFSVVIIGYWSIFAMR